MERRKKDGVKDEKEKDDEERQEERQRLAINHEVFGSRVVRIIGWYNGGSSNLRRAIFHVLANHACL